MSEKKETKVVKYGSSNDSVTEYVNWWTVKESETHLHLIQAVNRIDSSKHRRYRNIRNARLYSDDLTTGISTGAGDYSSIPKYKIDVRYNVIRSNIDTIESKISKNKPKVQFLTDGGNFKEKQKAKLLTNYVKGAFIDSKIYDCGIDAFRDCCIYGTGAFKFIKNPDTRRIDIERVLIDEILVDSSDGIYGKPKCLYQVTYVNRWVLEELYPDHKEAIKDTPSKTVRNHDTNGDLIQVIEAWNLPVTGSKTPGRHVICIANATLFYEPWDKTYFPYCFVRWSKDLTGFYGQGIADELADIQREINRTLRNISIALKLCAVPRTWVHDSNNVTASKITNVIGEIIKYSGPPGQPPITNTPVAMNQEAYNHLYWLIQSSYEKTGVSSTSATGRKDPGLNAAVAIRKMQDIETERFFTVSSAYENMYIEAARILIDLTRDLDNDLKDTGGLKVKMADSDEMKTIKWSDCNLDSDRFIMQLWPVNFLPDKPEGKLAAISELIQSQMLDSIQGQRLLNYPDLQSHYKTDFSAFELTDKILSKILYDGKYTPPEPYFNLDYSLKTAQNFYTQGKLEGAPEENLVLILRFIDEIERLIKILTPEPEEQENLPPDGNVEDVPPAA